MLEIAIAAVPDVLILYAFLIFLPFEIQGALRVRWRGEKGSKTRLGDTLSETIWSFTQGGTSRDWVGRFLALALGARLATLPWLFDGTTWTLPAIIEGGEWESPWLMHAPHVFVSLGITTWLLEHFPREGRTG